MATKENEMEYAMVIDELKTVGKFPVKGDVDMYELMTKIKFRSSNAHVLRNQPLVVLNKLGIKDRSVTSSLVDISNSQAEILKNVTGWTPETDSIPSPPSSDFELPPDLTSSCYRLKESRETNMEKPILRLISGFTSKISGSSRSSKLSSNSSQFSSSGQFPNNKLSSTPSSDQLSSSGKSTNSGSLFSDGESENTSPDFFLSKENINMTKLKNRSLNTGLSPKKNSDNHLSDVYCSSVHMSYADNANNCAQTPVSRLSAHEPTQSSSNIEEVYVTNTMSLKDLNSPNRRQNEDDESQFEQFQCSIHTQEIEFMDIILKKWHFENCSDSEDETDIAETSSLSESSENEEDHILPEEDSPPKPPKYHIAITTLNDKHSIFLEEISRVENVGNVGSHENPDRAAKKIRLSRI